MGNLGRLTPPDFEHVERYPLRALAPDTRPTDVPVVLGINWYSDFDAPQRYGAYWWVARSGKLTGQLRGGHAIATEPRSGADTASWWGFYNQQDTSACTGFSTCRALSLERRERYQAYWVYVQAQIAEGETDRQAGALVRDALNVIKTLGDVPATARQSLQLTDAAIGGDTPNPADRIGAYRWATSTDEILAALGTPNQGYVTLLNSWGRDYPHRVRMPIEVLDRVVYRENGEAAIVTPI